MRIKEENQYAKRSIEYFGSHSTMKQTKIDGSTDESDDIVFISSKDSEAACLWLNYLMTCFEQISRQQGRPPFKVRHIAIEDSVSSVAEEKIGSAHLQIVIMCSIFLDRVQNGPERAIGLSRQLNPERVLAMMLGVRDAFVTEIHKAALSSYNNWRKFFVKDQDENFVGELLGAAVGVLGTVPPSMLRNDKTVFSVHPKKVKLGHNRVIALLNDPLRTEDNVSVMVDRCGEVIGIVHVKRRNPYTLQFSIPERCLEVSMLIGVRITKNGCPLGVRQIKCESRLRELDQILRAHDNPLEFMCQTFGFNSGDREQLDNWMVHAFQRNIPPHFNLLSAPNDLLPVHKNHASPEENPTLLHFAARFGLERLAWQLLECPGGDLACDLRNISELTPADLAEQAGHSRLAHQLRGYMQMNEFTNMYSYLKVISESTADRTADGPSTNTTVDNNSNEATNHAIEEKEEYCRPRPLSEIYSVPPAARPIASSNVQSQCLAPLNANVNNLQMNYSIVPAPTPVIIPPSTPTSTSDALDLPLQGYMKMHPAGPKPVMSSVISNQPLFRAITPTQRNCPTVNGVTREDGQAPCTYGRTPSNSSTKSREPTGPQDELLEIINDFKNNVFTISEVERLVENWRNRNDVQQSFKDKQMQLNAMREEYERIQKKLKEEMKAPTPFDRIRKFFSKGKKDTKDAANLNDESIMSNNTEMMNGALADRRPLSSLSLGSVSSSSSSGRMSTVSGCSGTSLGDSGTHSDAEDRKAQNTEDKLHIMSYEIPPAPKPLIGRYSPTLRHKYPSSRILATNALVESTQPPSKNESTEYYIAFPPSGLPVHSFKSDGSIREPRTPGSPSEHSKCETTASGKHNDPKSVEQPSDPPSTKNNAPPFVPAPPSGMCIPSQYVNTTPVCLANPQKAQDSNSFCTVSEDSKSQAPVTKIEPVEEDRQDQDKSRNEECTKDPQNSCDRDESKFPEYMNLNSGQALDADKVIPAVPKKPLAPPIPPRGTVPLTYSDDQEITDTNATMPVNTFA